MNPDNSSGKSRFVVLYHEMPTSSADSGNRNSHWDLMLEIDGLLQTWALAEAPEPGCQTTAFRLSAHRLDYLNYEGPISGGRGSVSQVSSGYFSGVENLTAMMDDFEIEMISGSLNLLVRFKSLEDDNWKVSFLCS